MEDEERVTEEERTVGIYRKWFREAVDHMSEWRREAKQDYEFVAGKQWTDEDREALEKSGRPALTINRIKPLINVLSGYQRLNRYDIDFLPRTNDDMQICNVRKGMTKYILDECEYDAHESTAFLDAAIGGLGWLEVGYRFSDDLQDGEAFVKREDPFGIYIDPEAHRPDFSDANYIIRAKWADKDDLKEVYPEYAEDIEAQYQVYDRVEREDGRTTDPLWYKADLRKVRLVECWYKQKVDKTLYLLQDGSSTTEATPEMFLQGLIVGYKDISVTEVHVAVFCDEILLEDKPSPYQHGEIPLIPITCYYYGAGDVPAGFVRDLKDPQRELNKRKIQELHILNTAGNGGGWIEEDAMSPAQEREFEEYGNVPGHFTKVRANALAQGKILERQITSPPVGVIQAETDAANSMTAISGINEALMGVDIPSQASGRAIELKQKQAITHIAPMFDNLRRAKKKVAYQLWGKRNHPGIIPQYYTESKVYRIEGQNGHEFVPVNQQVVQQDPLGNVIHSTLNDLSQGEFDIIVSDTEASTTQRQAQMWGLVDAVQKLGVPGDLVFDLIIDLSDLPNKEDIKQRYQERQQSQQQAAQQQQQAQLQLEMLKNQNLNQSIAFKDAPLPIQFAMAAKQGLIDPQIAQYAVNTMVQQMFPQLAEQMAQQQAMQQQQAAQQQGAQQAMQQQLAQALAQRNGGGGQQQPSASTMTKPAIQSLISGAAPAM